MTTLIPFLALLTLLGLSTLAARSSRKRLATFRPHLSHALVALLLSGLALLLGPSPNALAAVSHPLANKGASLLQGQVLNGDDYLESPNGQYVALMQDDGNFVLYHVSSTGSFTNPYWSTLTSIGQNGFAAMQTDGNFVLYHGTSSTPGTPYWATNTNAGAGSYHLDLQSDGNLVLYNGATVVWASNTVTEVLTILSGDNQTGPCVLNSASQGLGLFDPLSVVLKNSDGIPLAGETIAWRVASTPIYQVANSLPTSTTNSNGIATLGQGSGFEVKVQVPGPVLITASSGSVGVSFHLTVASPCGLRT